jgi:hypothetical protein
LPSIGAYTQRNTGSPLDEYLERIEGYSPSTTQQLSSGSEGRRQVLETKPSYEATRLTGQQAGLEQPGSEGALQTLARWLTRAQSSAVGAASGALGRTQYTVDEFGAPVANAVTPGQRGAEALRRARAGWDMEQYYTWSDFGAIARRRSQGEDLSATETAYNFGKGLVLDTVTDPLTYVSFGGSIMGRIGASPIIRNRASRVLLTRVADPSFNAAAFTRNIVSERFAPVSARGVANRMQVIFEAGGRSGNAAVDDIIKSTKLNPNGSIDEIIQQIDERMAFIDDIIAKEKVENFVFDPYRTFALQTIPDIAGINYMLRGVGGAKRWINRNLGQDAGKAFWDALPNDIKGGIRIRAPFVRRSDGTAMALRIPGIGGGELSERLGKMGIKLDSVVEATERGRDIARQIALSIPGVPNLMYKGKGGNILADAILGATGKRRVYRWRTKDAFGAEQGDAFVDLLDYSTFNDTIFKSQTAAIQFSQEMAELHYVAAETLNKALKNIDDNNEKRRLIEMYWDILGDEGPEEYLTQAEIDIAQAAAAAKTFFDRYGDEAIRVTKDGRVAFRRLNNYAARRAREEELVRRYWERYPGYGGVPGAKTYNIKPRRHDVSLWSINKEGEAFVLRFKGPHQIYRAIGEGYDKIYLDDPLTVLADYAQSFNRTLDDLRLAGMMKSAGLFTPEQVARVESFDRNYIDETLVPIVGGSPNTESAMGGRIRTIQQVLADEYNISMGAATTQTIRNMSPERRQALARFLSEEMPGIGTITRQNMDNYVPSDAMNTWQNQIDGTTIELRGGSYIVKDIDGSDYPDPITGQPLIFSRKELAEQAMASIKSAERDALWNSKLVRSSESALDIINDIITTNPNGYHKLWENVEADQMAGRIDAEEAARRKDVLARQALRWLEAFNLEERIKVDENGVVDWGRAVQFKYTPKEYIRQLVESEGLYNQQLMGPRANGMARGRKVEIQARVVEHLGTVYAPKAMMDTFARMFQVLDEGNYSNFMRAVYYPYYSMVRSWLTVGRGPGFVFRNLAGGAWNNYINGVGLVHHNAAARLMLAKKRAQNDAIEMLGNNATPQEIQAQTFSNFMDFVRQSYKGSDTFVDGMNDADALTEIFQIGFNTGIIGGRSGRLVNEQLTYSNNSAVTAFSGLTRKKRREILQEYSYRRLPTKNEPIDIEPGKFERLMYKVGFDNPWIRDIMSPFAGMSEDYLRLAALIKGVQEMGLESADSGLRGFAASTWVKASQFDYQDLSYFEQGVFKNIMTFYTWARNNVPLQVRAAIHQPSHIANAMRIHRNLAYLFGDDDKEYPNPSYVDNQIMFRIDKSKFDWLPDAIEPRYDVAFGMPWADPLVDVNRWLQIPLVNGNSMSPIRREEIPNNLNPLLNGLWSLWEATTTGPDRDERDLGEVANWMRIIPGATTLSYTDAQLGLEGGREPELRGRRALREALTSIIPQLGLGERLIPFFGDARQQNRLLTSWVSAVAGIPFVTVDDYQIAGQMRRERLEYRQELEELFGDTAEYRIAMNKSLLDRGATPDFISALNAAGLPRNEVDVRRAQHAWELYNRYDKLIQNGTAPEEILAMMYAWSRGNAPAENLVEAIWNAVPYMAARGYKYRDQQNRVRTVSTDESEFYRIFAFSPATEEELKWLGFSIEEIDDMTAAEKIDKIIKPLIERRNGIPGR